jgi:hypothetical protein
MIGAPHWYVISVDGTIHEKFNHFEDALSYAKGLVPEEEIEVNDA